MATSFFVHFIGGKCSRYDYPNQIHFATLFKFLRDLVSCLSHFWKMISKMEECSATKI